MEMVDQVNVRKTFQVSQARGEFREYLDLTLTAFGINRLNGRLLGDRMFAVNNPNISVGERVCHAQCPSTSAYAASASLPLRYCSRASVTVAAGVL